jgi:hypothetical protein
MTTVRKPNRDSGPARITQAGTSTSYPRADRRSMAAARTRWAGADLTQEDPMADENSPVTDQEPRTVTRTTWVMRLRPAKPGGPAKTAVVVPVSAEDEASARERLDYFRTSDPANAARWYAERVDVVSTRTEEDW